MIVTIPAARSPTLSGHQKEVSPFRFPDLPINVGSGGGGRRESAAAAAADFKRRDSLFEQQNPALLPPHSRHDFQMAVNAYLFVTSTFGESFLLHSVRVYYFFFLRGFY